MTVAWYGHLKHKGSALWLAILTSWLLAFFEYCFQVPANRLGETKYAWTLTQLKVTQECISLVIFLLYAYFVFKEQLKWNTVVSMILILAAVFFAFLDRK